MLYRKKRRILARFREIKEKNISTVMSLKVLKFHSNMRTYAQTVDKLCITCDLTIYSM